MKIRSNVSICSAISSLISDILTVVLVDPAVKMAVRRVEL